MPPPDDSTPPLGTALTPEEQALSSTAPVADPHTKGSAPETRGATAQAAQTATAPAERPPVPEPTGASAVPVIVPVAPAAEHITRPAAAVESIAITPEERGGLTTLISQAALVDGFKGKGYVRAWLQRHYKIDVSDVAEIPPEIRSQVRAHALGVLERREQEALQKAPASTTLP